VAVPLSPCNRLAWQVAEASAGTLACRYVIVKGVLTADEVAAANAAIDHHSDAFLERKGALRNTKDGPLGFGRPHASSVH
jgi:hypothetical protein